MEPLAMEKVKRKSVSGRGPATDSRRGGLFLALCVLPCALCLAGCVSTGSFVNLLGEGPNSVPCQVVAAWNPGVVYTPDSAHGGAELPGLVGRIYLFGSEIGCPLTGDGSLVVDLYDDTAGPAGPEAHPLEEWQLDQDALKRLQRRDAVGWGYTVFLPWATYKPEINRVHLKVRYVPPKGFPLYAASSPITLGEKEPIKRWTTSVTNAPRKNDAVPKEGAAQATPPGQGITTIAGQQPRP